MKAVALALISFLIAIFAFGFGAKKLFKKQRPLYLKLYVCAAGCFALQQLSVAVNIWCGVVYPVSIGMFGILGCNFFLLSANYGTLDKIVDDGKGCGQARALAFVAPLAMTILVLIAFFSWRNQNIFCAIVWLIILMPAIPASYFNLKHILLPIDPFEFLNATRSCNIAALIFYTLTAVFVIFSALFGNTASSVLSVLLSLSVLILSGCAVKGASKWGI